MQCSFDIDNVISLFDGAMPLVAIRMQAFKVGDHVTLVFTAVLDELSRGLIAEAEEADSAPADRDRANRELRPTEAVLALADQLLEPAREIDPSVELNGNKFHIGLNKDGRSYNFVAFNPREDHVLL